jgi:hypothetical protein
MSQRGPVGPPGSCGQRTLGTTYLLQRVIPDEGSPLTAWTDGRSRFKFGFVIDNTDDGYPAVDGAILVDAFEGALKDLGLADRNDPVAQVVANHLVTFAKAGEHDPVRLRELTLEAVRVERGRARSTI